MYSYEQPTELEIQMRTSYFLLYTYAAISIICDWRNSRGILMIGPAIFLHFFV
jgi:hypothetical protein